MAWQMDNEWYFKAAVIGFTLDVMGSLLILVLFVGGLLRLTRKTLATQHRPLMEANSLKLLSLITRYTIISGVAVVSSILLGVAYSLMYYVWWKHGVTPFTDWLLHLFGAPDPVVNMICLALYYNFPLSTKIYGSLCFLCDTACKRVCACIAKPHRNETVDLS